MNRAPLSFLEQKEDRMQPHPHHPSTTAILKFFEYEHLPPHLGEISRDFWVLAHTMADKLSGTPHGAELTTGLRFLLMSKDCMVRAAL